MTYEKEYDIFYIDPGFQEYLFAEYYRSAEIEDIQELAESLKKTPYSKLLRFDALDMLSRSAELKFKTYVLKCMGVDHEFSCCLYTKDNIPEEGSIKKVSISEDTQISGILIGRDAELEGEKRLLIDCKPIDVYSYYNSEQSKGNAVGYYVGADNQLIQFGSELTIDTYFISTEPEEYKDLMLNIIDNSKTTYDMFKRVKQFYKRLKIEQHRNGQV